MSESDWESQDYRDRGMLLRIRALEDTVAKLLVSDSVKCDQIKELQKRLAQNKKQEGQCERINE